MTAPAETSILVPSTQNGAARPPPGEAAAAEGCATPADLGLPEQELARWTQCQKWVWHCVRNGKEANLFAKVCMHPRGDAAEKLRKASRFEPFINPVKYETSNALTDDFLIALLTDPIYVKQIRPVGIRIVGAYFKDAVNLENVSTNVNIVLDMTMARKGLRMTNFESAKNVSLDGSNIQGTLRLMRSRIAGSLFMERAALDVVDLNDADIGSSVEATGALFNGELRFNRAKIDGKVILTQARLTTVMAWNAHVGSALEMRLADVRVGVDLSGATVDGDVHLADVTFGRRPSPDACDWDPKLQISTDPKARPADLLSNLATSLSDSDFDAAWRETVQNRSEVKVSDGLCSPPDTEVQPSIRGNVLLRDMSIKGALCLMNITGDIEQLPGAAPIQIQTVTISGTDAKSTIVGWRTSASRTKWSADNYSTEHLLINLNTQPEVHYVDNLKLRVITFLRAHTAEPGRTTPYGEHVVKDGCDVTADQTTIEQPSTGEVQEKIIKFFNNDQSGSPQPFGAIVASLRSSGVNTSRLDKALSILQNRNACTASEFAKSYKELSWVTITDAWREAMSKRGPGQSEAAFMYKQTPLMVSDAGCALWQGIQYHTVRYGHEPLRLLFWIAVAVLVFTVLLRFDRKDPVPYLHRKPLGIVYAIDNLLPLKAYRISPQHSEELPKSAFLRGYLMIHRLIGLFFIVMAFLYIYKAS